MPELLVREGRLIVAGGRLITTANGAPCCCGGGGQCPCDTYPGLISPSTILYAPCVENVPTPTAIPGALFDQWTIRTVVAYDRNYEETRLRPFGLPTERYARQEQVRYETVVCVAQVRGIGEVTGLISATYLRILRQSGTRIESTVEETFETGFPALNLALPLTNEAIPGIGTQCTGISESGFFPINYQRTTFDYSDTPPEQRGQYTYLGVLTGVRQSNGDSLTSTDNRTASVLIQRTGRNCDGSGGGTGDRPGGCNGCGDPARLTLV